MSEYDYDVVFIGSGHASWHGATLLVQAGKRVAVVEEDTVGGTCVNWGCNAKLLVDTPFDLVDALENYRGLGVTDLPRIDWPALAAYKRANIGPMHDALDDEFSKAGISMLKGHGRLEDAHTVVVSWEGGGQRITTEYVVIGTGARPAVSDVPGKELLHDSKDFLDLRAFPRRIAFVGAGLISLEFAGIALKMGAETTVIGRSDRILRSYPKAYVEELVKKMHAEGAEFALCQKLAKVEQTSAGVLLVMESGKTYETDYVVDATGRVPNVENLGLEELGIAHSSRGIEVDDHLRTTVPTVFASGDCVDKPVPKLTPTAAYESLCIATIILGNSQQVRYPVVPSIAFTLPRIAQCGVAVDEALGQPELYRVERVPFGEILTFMARSDRLTDFTFVFDKDGYLVGCACMGADAGELVNVAAMVINLRLTRADLAQMIFSFPGTTYGFVSALIALLRE